MNEVSIENMSRDELIEAIVELQIHTFMSGQNLSELRHILMYGHGYKTRSGWDYSKNQWSDDELRNYAKDLGV